MDAQLNSKIELLIGRTLSMESKIESLLTTIENKINPNLDWVSDKFLEQNYGWTKAVRNSLVAQKKIKRYKPSGKAGASMYSKKEIDEAISQSVVYPKIATEQKTL